MNGKLKNIMSLDFLGTCSHRLPPARIAPNAGKPGRAILLTRDGESREWGPRWLAFSGFDVVTVDSIEDAVQSVAGPGRSLVIVDAAMKDILGRHAYTRLENETPANTPLLALCASDREIREVSKSSRAEVLRRPFKWEHICNRALRAAECARLRRKLGRTVQQLEAARLEAADAERNLASMQGLDSLTGLPSRELFRGVMQRSISAAATGESTGVLVIGIDRYSQVNATLGHEAGNRVLAQFAQRLRARLQDPQIIGADSGTSLMAAGGRIGGVRFGLVLSRAGVSDMIRLRDALLEDMDQPFEVCGQSIYLSTSMGAALFPTDAANADELLQCAEHAMTTAKSTGAAFRFFDKATDAAGRRALRMEGMLREAIEKKQLYLAYQPIMAGDGSHAAAAEALLRWNHPEEGQISPGEFVPAAERSGLMIRIGEFVLREAGRQVRAWMDTGLLPVRIAVNLSLCQLADDRIVDIVRSVLADNDLPPELLELELSERGVMNHGHEIIATVRELKELGVRISIDDFGSGNSAISYLKDFPADVIKIDRSYISGEQRSERDEAIGAGMVALAKRLDTDVVAEGVETQSQLERVQEWGCDEIQGFHFSAAIDADAFAGWLEKKPVPNFPERLVERAKSATGILRVLPAAC